MSGDAATTSAAAGAANGSVPAAPDNDAPEPNELEQAFNQLQSLFPGRVVEVRPKAADTLADSLPAPLDDESGGEGEYHDDDQDRLPFGPGGS